MPGNDIQIHTLVFSPDATAACMAERLGELINALRESDEQTEFPTCVRGVIPEYVTGVWHQRFARLGDCLVRLVFDCTPNEWSAVAIQVSGPLGCWFPATLGQKSEVEDDIVNNRFNLDPETYLLKAGLTKIIEFPDWAMQSSAKPVREYAVGILTLNLTAHGTCITRLVYDCSLYYVVELHISGPVQSWIPSTETDKSDASDSIMSEESPYNVGHYLYNAGLTMTTELPTWAKHCVSESPLNRGTAPH